MLPNVNETAELAFRQTASAEDYARAAVFAEQELTPTGKPFVRAVLCAAGAAISASTAPLSLREYGTMWIPLLFMAAFAAAGLWLFFGEPQRRYRERLALFATAPVFSLGTAVSFYRDFLLLTNECEELLVYWTEFSSCLENDEFAVLSGFSERRLVLLKKETLSPADRERFSAFLENTFASSYRSIRPKGGGRHGG